MIVAEREATLAGVAARATNDVWAVGSTGDWPALNALVMHFDGSRWKRVPVPSVEEFEATALSDVTAIAADDAWAVGHGSAGESERDRPLLLHWNGRRWQRVDVSRVAPRLNDLDAIDSAASDNVWAVGATGPNVGDYGYGPVFLRWDGRRWREVRAGYDPSDFKNPLSGAVDVSLSAGAWTLHREFGEPGSSAFVRFDVRNGGTHDVFPFPYYQEEFEEANANDVAVVSTKDVWAVGDSYLEGVSSWHPLISHWTGTSWRHQRPSFGRLNRTALSGVSAVSATDVWAVGDHLVVRYSC